MKYLFSLAAAFLLSATSAHAGRVLWIDASMVSSYQFKEAGNCKIVSLGVGKETYTHRVCFGQDIVEADMNDMLTSPSQRSCVIFERCRGNYCERTYGSRSEKTKLMLVIGAKNVIEDYRAKRDIGACQ